ncbi:MAG: TIGR03435 family protein [Armatimonadota bacterium]
MYRGFIARFSATVLLCAGIVFAQTPAAPKAFEVATIKPADMPNMAQIAAGKMRVGMKIEAGRVDIGFMSLADLIHTAYKLKSYQVTGPDWMNSARFDILAKMPEGATKDDVPEMLKALLADRFKLTVHKESKEHPMYALVVGKGGPKLKESPPDPVAPPEGTPPPPPAKGEQVIATNNGTVRINQNGDGRGATITTPGEGVVKTSMGGDGNMHMEMSKIDMPKFADMISRFVDRPVVDETGLKGNFQVSLDLSMADMMRVARASGAPVPPPGAMPGGGAADAASDPGSGGSVFTAVQAMGLKLDGRKETIEMIVIDHLEKTPTEN